MRELTPEQKKALERVDHERKKDCDRLKIKWITEPPMGKKK